MQLVRASGREVVGVYDPAEFADGKDRLLECGVADVVEAGAHPDEFLRVIARVAQTVVTATLSEAVAEAPIHEVSERRSQALIAIGGPAGGTGATEVAIAIAVRLGESGRRVVLVDCDETNPSVAQRLALPIHPNIRTAIDVLEHRTGPVASVIQVVGPIAVIPGLPNVGDWSEVRPGQVADLAKETEDPAELVRAFEPASYQIAPPAAQHRRALRFVELLPALDEIAQQLTGSKHVADSVRQDDPVDGLRDEIRTC